MHWSRNRDRSRFLVSCAACLLVLLSAVLLAGAPEEKRLAIYSRAANYSVAVTDRNGQEYAGLVEILDPLGTVTAKTDRSHWKLRFNDIEAEFTVNKTRVKMHGGDLDLPAPFLLDGDRGLVPLASIESLMPRILGGPVSLHDLSRRLFIGSVGTHFTAAVTPGNPPQLVMNFTAPVSPAINQESGRLRMVFRNDPVVAPGSPLLTFGNPTIPSASYSEGNGVAEITVSGAVPLTSTLSNDGRTITITPAGQTASRAAIPAPPAAAAEPFSSQPRRYFAVIDASHGGSERGAALSDSLAEKDVTLAFARLLRQELSSRGLTSLMIRDNDATIGLDQRAGLANGAHPAVYIAMHASAQGKGVRIYNVLLPPSRDGRGPFVDWNTAQSGFRVVSQSALNAVLGQLQRNQIPSKSYTASLRPLNNITTAAIAVEVGPVNTLDDLRSVAYQQSVCFSIASGVASVRAQLEAGK